MAFPEQPGSIVGETATAGNFTWEWNGYAWDLQAESDVAEVNYLWNMYPHPMQYVEIDY